MRRLSDGALQRDDECKNPDWQPQARRDSRAHEKGDERWRRYLHLPAGGGSTPGIHVITISPQRALPCLGSESFLVISRDLVFFRLVHSFLDPFSRDRLVDSFLNPDP